MVAVPSKFVVGVKRTLVLLTIEAVPLVGLTPIMVNGSSLGSVSLAVAEMVTGTLMGVATKSVLATGGKLVTAVVTGGILAGSQVAAAFEPLPLILMIVAGTFVVSYVTDPYFWIVQKATDEGVGRVIRNYTLPLAACGFVILAVAAALQLMM